MAWFVKLALAKLGYGELTRKSNELQLIYSIFGRARLYQEFRDNAKFCRCLELFVVAATE
jgi:hypothetical protein